MSTSAASLRRALRAVPAVELRREAARRRLRWFAHVTYPGYWDAGHARGVLIPALEWAGTTPNARLIVTMPPRHSKSVHVSELFPAWFLGTNPDKRIIAATHTMGLSYTFSRRVRNRVNDARYPFDVRVADDKGAVQAWDIAGHRGGYIAASTGMAIAGHGGDGLIIDDYFGSAAEADSETEREKLKTWYRESFRTRLEPGGFIIITATRWHVDDLIGFVLAEEAQGGERWRLVHMPAVDDDGAALWPERWPLETLSEIRRAVGSRAWESQYQGRPLPASGGILKPAWFRFWQYGGQNLPPVRMDDGEGHVVEHPVIELPSVTDQVLQSWDLTFKQTAGGSYVVGLAAAVRGALVYLLDRRRERLDFPGTIRAMQAMRERWPETMVTLVEDRANGPAVMDTLRPHVPGIVAVSPDGSKEARMHAAAPFVEGGGFVLPHPANAPWVEEYMDELATFPLGAHDDDADATSQLIRRVAGGAGLGPVGGDLASYLSGQFGG